MPRLWSRPAAPALFSGLLALAVRATVGAQLAGTPLTRVLVGDSQGYRETARLILDGRLGEVGVFFQAPLYPFFLAALDLLGGAGWGAIAAAQVLLACLTCAAMTGLAARVFPGRATAPWLAGTAAALYGPLVFFDMEVLPASLAVSLLTSGICLFSRSAGGSIRDIGAGLLLGAAALLAPALLAILLLAAVVRLLEGAPDRRGALARAGLLVGGALVVLAPIAWHNLAAGDVVLISSNGGVNAFIGNNPQATGAFLLPPGSGLDGTRLEASAAVAAERSAGRLLRPSQVSSHWMGQAISYASSQPLGWIRLLGRKSLLAINHYEIPNHLNLQFVAPRFARLLEVLLPFWIVFPLAGLGAVVAWRDSTWPGRLVVGAAAISLGLPVLFFVTARYRLPALPFLLVLAAGGTAWLCSEARARRWKGVLGGVAVLVVLLWPTRLVLVREGDFAFDHLLLGAVQRQLGDLDGSILEFKLAEETGPPGTDAAYRLARALEARGNTTAAVAALERHLARHAGDLQAAELLRQIERSSEAPGVTSPPQTQFELALAHDRDGDLESAAAGFRRAVQADPAHGWAWAGLGAVRGRQGQKADAVRALQRASELEPSSPVIWSNLAVVLFQEKRLVEARKAAERCLELDPAHPEARAVLDRTGE